MPDEFPPYVPMPSLGHELGLMFGFFSLCLAVMAAYVVVWRISQSRFRAQDLARRKAIRNNRRVSRDPQLGTSSIMGKRNPNPAGNETPEKMSNCYTIPEDLVELPIHGMELLRSEKVPGTMMGPLSSNAVRPLSPLGSRGVIESGSAAGVGIGHSPRDLVSPVGGDEVESIIGLAPSLPQGRSQSPLPVREIYRSVSPARRAGGQSGVVEIGPTLEGRVR
ncbi:unnamed protein product [Penicillium salamii]|uniref:Uncharacterized protein n=1 Tax=Penicillium salamii TaxID=1612424 RepID=A0A9W4JAF2_9EURO|nr:unnamed protein product [Penicillium salamii]CAG8109374.1 unnamed protein product [Penicillium salamii]CAG8312040.1 unnamed protein product [Penicillium salamii]CAG8360250.1 unnamed protein product [Penicillium salamii]CAG8386218.1 unnamed protein product [Penicillium salamii]